MTEKHPVVTQERFISGFTYKEYVAQIERNSDGFQQFYEKGGLSADDKAFFSKSGRIKDGFAKMLVISEDWCPYAIRAVPVMAHIAAAAKAELRIFTRDANLDIMKQFLHQGRFMTIPVAVFFTNDLSEICRWIEKPGMVVLKPDENLPVRKDFQQECAREMRLLLSAKLGF